MRSAIVLPGVLLGSLLAGCGGDDSAQSSSPTSPTAANASSGPGAGGGSTTGTAVTTGSSGAGGSAGAGGGEPVATVPYVYVGTGDDQISVYLLDRATGALAL